MKAVISAITAVILLFSQSICHCQNNSGVAAPDDDLSKHPWALRQMLWLLRDRPDMARFPIGDQLHWVVQDHEIWRWAAARFAGAGTGFQIGWGEAEPDGIFDADHYYTRERGWIRIRKSPAGQPRNTAFESQWQSLVFEFFNQENAAGFGQLWEQALAGSISSEKFVTESARLEHRALAKCQDFYSKVWKPWCQKSGFKSDESIWIHGFRASFDEWLAQYPRDFEYPWKVYQRYYQDARDSAKLEAAR
jgi:hypothetical protein